MTTDKKLYVAVGVLVVLGGVLWIQKKEQSKEAATYTVEHRQSELPKIEVSEDDTKAIDKITIRQAAGDAGKEKSVTLVKKDDKWSVSEPISAVANDTNVSSLLSNLKSLKVVEQISPGTEQYEKYELTDARALHAVFYKGEQKLQEFYFGQSGSRGQMTRLAGKDGVYAVKNYSSFLYARDTKDWRDRSVLKFEDTKVKQVEIDNEHGSFLFAKEGDKWAGKFKKAKAPAPAAIKNFDDAKVGDMLRTWKALSADNYDEEGKTPADRGLEPAQATVAITLDDGARRVLKLGSTAEGSSRWALKEGESELFSVGSYAADWAFKKLEDFTKSEEKKDAKKDEPEAMPMPMPMPEGFAHGPDDGHGH
jgi:hypothetical protein